MGRLFRPNERQVAQLAKKDYLGKATVSRLRQLGLRLLCCGPCADRGGTGSWGEGTPSVVLPRDAARDWIQCGALTERWADASSLLSLGFLDSSLPA